MNSPEAPARRTQSLPRDTASGIVALLMGRPRTTNDLIDALGLKRGGGPSERIRNWIDAYRDRGVVYIAEHRGRQLAPVYALQPMLFYFDDAPRCKGGRATVAAHSQAQDDLVRNCEAPRAGWPPARFVPLQSER